MHTVGKSHFPKELLRSDRNTLFGNHQNGSKIFKLLQRKTQKSSLVNMQTIFPLWIHGRRPRVVTTAAELRSSGSFHLLEFVCICNCAFSNLKRFACHTDLSFFLGESACLHFKVASSAKALALPSIQKQPLLNPILKPEGALVVWKLSHEKWMHYHQKEIIENSSSSSSREFLNFVLNAFCPSSTTARSRHSFQPCFSIDHFEKCIIHTIVGKSLKNVSFDNFPINF